MQNLILLTNGYPYGTWEPYLETEVEYYNNYFEDIYICSLQVRQEHGKTKRRLPGEKFKVCRVDYAPRYVYLLNSFRALLDINFYRELWKLICEKRLTFHRMVRLVVFVTRSHYEARKILKFLKGNGLREKEGLIYSYRLEYQPYVGMLIRKKYPNLKIIARGHGSDLFEERNRDAYIPLRQEIISHIDRIFLIAEDGKKYLSAKYPVFKNRMEVSRLGTRDYGMAKIQRKQGCISIVSCSAVVSIKRIDRIVCALALIKGIEVRWTHFGEGVLLEKLKSQCQKILPANIHYDFRGFVPNQNVLFEYYQGGFHLFLNVSESEGVPVSIMEAMSFGIPCIATDVGGTGEIITDAKDGVLLRANFDSTELAEWICKFAEMDNDEYQEYRRYAREAWDRNYNAEKNYNKFCKKIAEE